MGIIMTESLLIASRLYNQTVEMLNISKRAQRLEQQRLQQQVQVQTQPPPVKNDLPIDEARGRKLNIQC
jgi:hypothetical protein